MPDILIIGSIHFRFYSEEGSEPPHVHAIQGRKKAKFWLEPVRFASNHGFAPHELTRIRRMVIENQELFMERFNELHAR